ncbi:hypothetical protein [Rhodopirellula sp. SWK7]|uniref:hypothetical protein n=1 Tax=Rhodopirellula sp. SWK7 TaxID=595460 RepID=UPI00156530B1|nr:hypothetical protein [Rhodopirellula sp. SWK7]
MLTNHAGIDRRTGSSNSSSCSFFSSAGATVPRQRGIKLAPTLVRPFAGGTFESAVAAWRAAADEDAVARVEVAGAEPFAWLSGFAAPRRDC